MNPSLSHTPKDMDPRFRGDDIEAVRTGGVSFPRRRESIISCQAYEDLLKLIPARREPIFEGEV
jgi:hypothetical protein